MLSQKTKHCAPSTLERKTQVLLILTPWIAISAIASSPALAATFASSEGFLEFSDFNYHPYSTDSFAGTNSLALIKADATVASISYASAHLSNHPYYVPFGGLFSSGLTLGTGHDYLGISQGQAQIMGSFLIEKPDHFKFNFAGFLNSITVVDFPEKEFAKSSGTLAFALLDTTHQDQINLLDYFILSGQSSNILDKNFTGYHYSDSIQASFLNAGGMNLTHSLAHLSFSGELSRYFDSPTHLTLIAINAQEAQVKVPEPNSIVALVLFGLAFSTKMRHKRQIK
jgi:hypothetical protein